jgi:hypothetical protein
LAALLNCTLTLLQQNRLSQADKALLCHRLDELLVENDYANVEPTSRAAFSVSLVRVNCVRLARALQDSGCTDAIVSKWAGAAAADPLPEVRFV